MHNWRSRYGKHATRMENKARATMSTAGQWAPLIINKVWRWERRVCVWARGRRGAVRRARTGVTAVDARPNSWAKVAYTHWQTGQTRSATTSTSPPLIDSSVTHMGFPPPSNYTCTHSQMPPRVLSPRDHNNRVKLSQRNINHEMKTNLNHLIYLGIYVR